MSNYVPNEIIVTLSETNPAVLFKLNNQVFRQLSMVQFGNKPEEKLGEPLDEVIDEILETLYREKVLDSPPDELLRPVVKPVFLPGSLIGLSDKVLDPLQKQFGDIPPLYDIRIAGIEEPPAQPRFYAIEQIPDWLAAMAQGEQESLYAQGHEFNLTETREDIESGRAATYLLCFRQSVSVGDAVKAAVRNNKVKHAEPNYIGELCSDGWLSKIKHPNYIGAGGHSHGITGANVTVAIVDSGIRLIGEEDDEAEPEMVRDYIEPEALRRNYPEQINQLLGRVEEKWRFLDVVHFTRRCSTMNASDLDVDALVPVNDGLHPDNWPHDETNHGTRLAWIITQQMAPDSRFLPIRAFFAARGQSSGIGTLCDVSTAIGIAIDAGAEVINLSFRFEEQNTTLLNAIKRKPVDGSRPPCIIVALGNDGTDEPVWPAAYASWNDHDVQILGVGGVEQSLGYFYLSNFGAVYGDFVVGPASEIKLWWGDEELPKGTSFAAAFVSGLAALIISLAKTRGHVWTRNQIYKLIRENANKTFDYYDRETHGHGFIDVDRTLRKADELFPLL